MRAMGAESRARASGGGDLSGFQSCAQLPSLAETAPLDSHDPAELYQDEACRISWKRC